MNDLRILIFVLLFVASNALAQEAKMKISEIIRNDIWAVAEGMHENVPLTIRFRNEFQKKPDVSEHPYLIQVTWSYVGGDSGMPDNLTNEKMGIFEDRLTNTVETDMSAVLAAVITNDGKREWVFYASDVQEFANRMTQMPQEKERYPIELTTEQDPEWKFLYGQILSGMSEKETQ